MCTLFTGGMHNPPTGSICTAHQCAHARLWCTYRTTRAFCMQVASAFSHMLNLHNLSEEVADNEEEHAVRLGEVSG